MRICIYAAASDRIDPRYMRAVENIGEKLAKEGHSLIYGGGGTGLMGAAARGFRRGGAEVVGVVPTFMFEIEPTFNDCTKIIETEDMADRKEIMENGCDAFIIVPGGVGTMDELFQALTLRDLDRHNKPITLYNINGYYTKLIEFINDATEKGFIGQDVRDFLNVVDVEFDEV